MISCSCCGNIGKLSFLSFGVTCKRLHISDIVIQSLAVFVSLFYEIHQYKAKFNSGTLFHKLSECLMCVYLDGMRLSPGLVINHNNLITVWSTLVNSPY